MTGDSKTEHRQRVLKQARACQRWGWSFIPIPKGQKAPRIKGWTKLRMTIPELEEALGAEDGIGILLGVPSNGLIDVDIDCSEAIAVASEFLPPTERIHGRKGRQ